ncbi:hypothetical protein MBAV_000020 [Candidatus Magnetobacterium bavaricum]|uniref:Uncharacterized protein n=1 Tax=Candidatus Magnetobacterium bavaricum TaxID=29290 RepID=A0A0F3H0V8_9BACT|nr:hypothetical protein MBAV_000020 [Candidatus Magnetobacterium bavaricum]
MLFNYPVVVVYDLNLYHVILLCADCLLSFIYPRNLRAVLRSGSVAFTLRPDACWLVAVGAALPTVRAVLADVVDGVNSIQAPSLLCISMPQTGVLPFMVSIA